MMILIQEAWKATAEIAAHVASFRDWDEVVKDRIFEQ